MKSILTTFLIVGLVMLCMGTVLGQSVGDYQSAANGNWNAAATWQKWNGSTWVATATPPTGLETVTIDTTDTVAVNVPVTITDTLINRGTLTADTNLTIGATGVYQHDRDAGNIPRATWSAGSTLYLTGVTAVAPNNRRQNYHHIVFNTPNLGANLNMDLDSVTIGGDIKVINTGASRWYLTSALAGDSSIISITGDIIVEGGQFSSNGTGNANTVFKIHQYGDIIVTGGNLSISRGSQGSGTGSTRWYLHDGNFSMSNATTQNSNAANAWFVFDKAGTQTLTLGDGNTLTSLPIVVENGTTLDMGLSKLRGAGRFELHAGSVVAIAEPGGLDSSVVVTGTVRLDSMVQYIYKAAENQVTGITLPDTVYSIVNENANTLTLSDTTTIYGGLFLRAGVFDNTIPFDLGGVGYIRFEGGNLLLGVPVSAEETRSTIPLSFFVDQNYPNPFNPTTMIVYGLPAESHVTAKVYNMLGQVVATLFDGKQSVGTHRLSFDASRLPSGAYIYTVRAGTAEISKHMMLVR
ncbi:MAG TPA: T9SS type A sorting domain-containing protein [Bacteroidota bacterium]|nr:T9SS type A sorting domain-containing protein [Bacteroidota bacterium]